MKFKLIHMDLGVLAESDKKLVLEDLKKYYINHKKVASHILVIVKGDQQ